MARPKSYCGYPEQTEIEFSKPWFERLEPYFHIYKQVSGIHLSGKKMRIDAVISPKCTNDWKNKNIAFGLEFKSPTKIDRLHNQTDFIKQCIDYSYTNFENFGYIPILSCPFFEFDSTYSNDKSLTAIRHLLNSFNVGELDITYRGLSIVFAQSHFIWNNGSVILGKSWTFEKKFGCRK